MRNLVVWFVRGVALVGASYVIGAVAVYVIRLRRRRRNRLELP